MRNIMAIMGEYNEQYYSKVYKTEIYERPSYNDKLYFPKYSVSIFVGNAEVKLAYYDKRDDELRISICDISQNGKCMYLVRYYDLNEATVVRHLEMIKRIIYEMPHNGNDMSILIKGFIDLMPWM